MIALKEQFGIETIKGMCQNYTSRIFGFIMYTRSHSYIVKVLRDNDFWNELDEISGANWPIFSIKPLEEHYYKMPSMPRDAMCQMVPIRVEPNENREFLDFFSLKESSDLPCFIVFIWNEDDKIEQITWKLSNASEREAFDSIREIVTLVSETEAQVLPRYKRSVNIYRNVKCKIEGRVFKHRVARGLHKVARIKELLTSLIG
ncbi:hypothetical protein [Parabacteroides sp.]